MKTVILAGGFGTRISEESDARPKPMIEIGGKPILWHIMKSYSHYGFNDFIICCGYKSYYIKEYFINYASHLSDIEVDLEKNTYTTLKSYSEPWKITLIDTGTESMTGGRLKRVYPFIKDEKEFCFTYGDGVSDVNIQSLIEYHKGHGKLATVTATYPPGRFGALEIVNNQVLNFEEKPKGDGALINGGFFVLSPRVVEKIDGDHSIWEKEPLEELAKNGELMSFKHEGFWHSMDTLRDKIKLNELIDNNKAPWVKWDQ